MERLTETGWLNLPDEKATSVVIRLTLDVEMDFSSLRDIRTSQMLLDTLATRFALTAWSISMSPGTYTLVAGQAPGLHDALTAILSTRALLGGEVA